MGSKAKWLFTKTQEMLIRIKYESINFPLKNTSDFTQYSPFFIMGSGRSGTTILRKILQQNDQIVVPPESGGLLEKSIKLFIAKNHLPWDSLVKLILNLWRKSPDFEYWKISGQLTDNELLELPISQRNLDQIISHVYLTYGKCHKPKAYLWGDKTPYATFGLDWIKELYPNGRIIHMLRDGRDVVNSFLKHQRCGNIEQACTRWNDSVNILSRQHANMKVITIRYEHFVSNPKSVMNKLSEFLNCQLNYSEEAKPVFLGDDHLSHHSNLGRKLHQEAVGNWKEELGFNKIQTMNKLILPNLKKFGYA